jgi:hypothetical protein
MTSITRIFLPVSVLFLGMTSSAAVFLDTFGDGSIPNNSNVNTDVLTRQSGTLTSDYTHTGATSGTLISNNDGISTGENFARIRNNEQDGGASAGFLTLDTNFASLAGSSYTISFDFLYNKRATSTTDQWVSFAISETALSAAPNGGNTDFGILMRPDGVGNPGVGDNFARFYSDGSFSTGDDISGTLPSFTSSYVTFTVSVVEDGSNGALISVDAGGTTLLTDFAVDFGNGDRYFGFGSNLGADINGPNATEFADLFIDNVAVNSIPEPSTIFLLGGAFALMAFQSCLRRK